MATRRMFSKTITSSSRFLMMPQSTQNLYFHLGMNADDDGFCEHFTIMRMTESKPDDLKILQAKGFVHVFDDRVLVILDWKENNYLRSDRYTPSKYLEIYTAELKAISEGVTECLPVGIPDGDTGKDRLGKVSIGKVKNKAQNAPFDEDSFNIFWNIYDNKVSKKKAQQAWAKINPDLYQTIFNHARQYRNTKQGREYPYHPHNYLRDEHWNDEIIITHKDAGAIKSEMSKEEYAAYLQQKAKENEGLFQ